MIVIFAVPMTMMPLAVLVMVPRAAMTVVSSVAAPATVTMPMTSAVPTTTFALSCCYPVFRGGLTVLHLHEQQLG
jgi:hypothetical protein